MKSLLRSGSARPAALAAVLLAGLGTSAHAQLILHLDTAAKDLWFTGTDTGTGGDFNGLYYTAQWAAGAAGLVKFFDVKLDSSLISISGNSYYTLGDSGFSRVGAYTDGTETFVNIALATSDEATLTGTGTKASYSGWSPEAQGHMEAFLGSSLPLVIGSGFDPISVVPEPHEYALMAGLGLVGFAGWRRWRRQA